MENYFSSVDSEIFNSFYGFCHVLIEEEIILMYLINTTQQAEQLVRGTGTFDLLICQDLPRFNTSQILMVSLLW